jgi:hypothetical protein
MLKDSFLIVATVLVAAALMGSAITMATTRVTEKPLSGGCSKVSEESWFGTVLHYDKVVCGDELKKITNKRRPLHF